MTGIPLSSHNLLHMPQVLLNADLSNLTAVATTAHYAEHYNWCKIYNPVCLLLPLVSAIIIPGACYNPFWLLLLSIIYIDVSMFVVQSETDRLTADCSDNLKEISDPETHPKALYEYGAR